MAKQSLSSVAAKMAAYWSDMEAACRNRDKRALYSAVAKSHVVIRPSEPVDVCRVRAVAHCYASQIYGWEVEDA